jgi:hypothetical protein
MAGRGQVGRLAVVEQDPAELVRRLDLRRLRAAGAGHVGRHAGRDAAGGEDDLAVPVGVVDVRDRVRPDRGHQHRLGGLAGLVAERQAQRHGRGQRRVVRADLHVGLRRDGQLGEAVELARRAADPHQVTGGDRRRGAAGQEDEDAVGGGARGDRAVPAAAGGLHVEAAVAAGAVVGGHDALDGDPGAGQAGGRAGALHLGDRVVDRDGAAGVRLGIGIRVGGNGVELAEAVRGRGPPGPVDLLQRVAGRGAFTLGDADVHAGRAGRGAAGGGEGALVRQELGDRAGRA